MNICAIVPSFNPDEKLADVVNALRKSEFEHIIVVDDGSKEKHYFNEIEKYCDVLHHYKNLGKGRAMKTAFNYYLNNYSDACAGVVIVDGDNQHGIVDICACSEALLSHLDSLILGVRDFNSDNVPKRSKFGNKITAWVFMALCGLNISDTQTGLRAISNEGVKTFLDTAGERFEYETNMLLETKRNSIHIHEVKIQTIYIEENKTSHFNPLTDSISIYKVLIKFLWASIASTVIDFVLFAILLAIFSFTEKSLQIFLATALARAASSLFNFTVNKSVVFKNSAGIKCTLYKYYTLCVLQMLTSYGGVYGLTLLLGNKPILLKIFVDFILFIISFQIQREWVFKHKKG